MKKATILLTVAIAATTAFCAGARKKGVQAMAGNEDGPTTSGREAKVTIDQMPKTGQIGRASCRERV